MGKNSDHPNAGTEGARQGLLGLREAVLHLHKTLVDSERADYEKTFGTIKSPNQFLQLLTSDPWFAWLRPLSQLIVAMDELLDAKEPLTWVGVEALAGETERMLVATETGEGFPRHYHEALQRDPDVVMAASEVNKQRGKMNGK
jgi:hypothetical protein